MVKMLPTDKLEQLASRVQGGEEDCEHSYKLPEELDWLGLVKTNRMVCQLELGLINAQYIHLLLKQNPKNQYQPFSVWFIL